jgi:hypothetical protein
MAQTFREKEMKANRFVIFILIGLLTVSLSGCGLISGAIDNVSNAVGLTDTGTVIAKRAQIRSSYAVVAADLLEVKRGDKLDILEREEFDKVFWYRVRAHDDEQTEGWIEVQNVINSSLLAKSKELAEKDKARQSQATGQLRAASKLRLDSELKEENVLFQLDNGSTFEIIEWKYVPRVQDAESAKKKNEEVESAKEANKPKEMDEVYDIWYKVRLTPDVSPAPAGWLFGRQVELAIPTDIAIYQKESNKIVTWQKLDGAEAEEKFSSKDSGAKISKPGSWVILLRSNVVKATSGDGEPDFDSILVLGYDKYNQEHYKGHPVMLIEGKAPLKVEGTGDNKNFSVQIKMPNGQLEEKRFVLFKDAKGWLKLTPPPDIPIKKDDK